MKPFGYHAEVAGVRRGHPRPSWLMCKPLDSAEVRKPLLLTRRELQEDAAENISNIQPVVPHQRSADGVRLPLGDERGPVAVLRRLRSNWLAEHKMCPRIA